MVVVSSGEEEIVFRSNTAILYCTAAAAEMHSDNISASWFCIAGKLWRKIVCCVGRMCDVCSVLVF